MAAHIFNRTAQFKLLIVLDVQLCGYFAILEWCGNIHSGTNVRVPDDEYTCLINWASKCVHNEAVHRHKVFSCRQLQAGKSTLGWLEVVVVPSFLPVWRWTPT